MPYFKNSKYIKLLKKKFAIAQKKDPAISCEVFYISAIYYLLNPIFFASSSKIFKNKIWFAVA